ncbi:hypothetical protein [Pelagicoccus mobilis]|uniref:Uncharacterized protein n=1 Tax=Pelagicoccus mobilis TaxID=415221 RepID=A0A934RXS5_9BACT|nr:hypothetical protein [Pelagicoccus mobilis]MBK1876312.1 hypothetical protein [Pelagicoccus mobilis]
MISEGYAGIGLSMMRFVCAFLLLLIGSWPALARAAEVELVKLDFDLVEAPGGRDPWYQIALTLSVERGERASGANPRFMDDLEVRFSFATSAETQAGLRYRFYSAAAEYPTLEVGRHVVRYYLPPELVKRDRVRGEPFAFVAEVLAGEDVVESVLSDNLKDRSNLANFRERLRSGENSVLRLQDETPFAWSSPRDTPVAKRRQF